MNIAKELQEEFSALYIDKDEIAISESVGSGAYSYVRKGLYCDTI